MIKAFYTAASGMKVNQFYTNAISNNIANMYSHGYKKVRPEFKEALYNEIERRETAGVNLNSGNGTLVGNMNIIMNNGEFIPTNNKLDLAIEGKGFFAVENEQNTVTYTRYGGTEFKYMGGNEYQLNIRGGGAVLDVNGNRITFDGKPEEREVKIYRDGRIFVNKQNEGIVEAGQIGVFTFTNPQGLGRAGGSHFYETEASGPAGDELKGNIMQGALENANVEIYEEMTDLIMSQKAYQFSSRVLQTADEMEALANSLVR